MGGGALPTINTVEPWDGKDGVVSRENSVRVDGWMSSFPVFNLLFFFLAFPQLPMEDDIDLSDVDLDDLEKDEL